MNTDLVNNVRTFIRMHSEGVLGGETMPEDSLRGVVRPEHLPSVLTLGMAWEKALSGTELAPIDIHTPLWLWRRSGFISLS